MGTLRNIGVILPDLGNAYFFDVIKQMHQHATASNYRMLMADSDGDPDSELASALDLLGYVDGLVLLSSRISAAGLRELAKQHTPVVLVNRVELGVNLPVVAVDSFTSMLEICSHLAQLGHHRVVYLSGSPLAWQSRERWRAVQTARIFGIDAVSVECDGTIDTAYSVTEEVLTHHPTAIICFNDLSAIGAISKLRSLGLSVPQDISVTGFDDIVVAQHFVPALTTIRSPKGQLGDRAWALMKAALAKEEIENPPLLTADVILRDSTGPAPR
jgi:LacI family transcriptional regulator